MRYYPALVAVLLVAAVAACGSSVKLPPVEPEEVELFLPGSFPTDEYKVLTRILERVSVQVEDMDLIERAKERAARAGADALIVSSIRTTAEGGIDFDLQQEVEKILEGLAIYYPSQHPELTQ